MKMNQPKTLAVALLLLFASQAWAWGAERHQLSGMIAQQLLTPDARQAVERIIPRADFAELSTWMDVHKQALKRSLPGSDRWHYQDIAACDGEPEPSCADGNCAGPQIERLSLVLADHAASQANRAQALTFLIHLVGDIHQPLHAADNQDHGGNLVKVSARKAGWHAANLHALWDTTLVAESVGDTRPADWIARQTERYASDSASWRQGRAADWLEESNQIARVAVYQPLPDFRCAEPARGTEVLSASYLERGQRVVEQQVFKAGVRIAMVINQALDPAAQK